MKPTVAVIGASRNRAKYGNKAVRAYARQGYAVYPIHPEADAIEGHRAYRSVLDVPEAELDIVPIYLPPHLGMQVIEEVARKPVREVIFNPGADSRELLTRARELGLNAGVMCSILAVGSHPGEFE